MKLPSRMFAHLFMRTDPSKKITYRLFSRISLGNKNSKSYSVEPGISIMPSSVLKVSTGLEYSYNNNDLMYVNVVNTDNGDKYILGEILQHTLSATLRIDYNITPEFSIQYYASPFASVGRYSDFKVASNTLADNYENRFYRINPDQDKSNYTVSENENGETYYTFENPDFNFSQFRSNFVVRWEYRPGSQLYFVWSNEGTADDQSATGNVNDAMDRLRYVTPSNIFLVKFNYWFSI